ncbi:MAG: C25 family cysteine peptidase, partial [Candidatus Cloacimonadota bacterium]|nr:C25 family cysteine peptidase [Candidatus Cloacimonadota bacterium]
MRKRFLYFILFWLISNILYAETIECFPEKPKLGKFGNYSIIKNLISHSGDVGSPMIPLSSVFMKLPVNKKIANVKISFLQSESIFLDHPLIPIQQMQPLVKKTAPEFVLPSDVAYHKRVYPDNKLFKVSYGFCGSSKIGQISFYSIKYLPLQQVIEVPSKVKIEYDLVTGDSKNRKITTDNYTTSRIKQEIGLKNSKNDIQPVYLLIFPQALSSAYADLAEWRNKQGITVITETYENILSLSSGVDEQEKLRNFIIEMYQEHQISHLTLGADVSIIPSRIAFAFDCDYGLADNENDLLCDMYYGCLDGNWDANGNGIYGEDEDETDYWAEVYVSRIPAENSAQVEYYIEKLKQYEQGEIEQYEKAGGFSMQLWPGCSSEICQQFIYEIFFPQNYQIELLYGENNNEDAAYQLLNDNLNLAQHTGHGWFTSLSLENGQISHNNISNLQNEWGGIFYSIGCWTAAMDYNAIGESLVRKIDAGFLGYVGNSRYGWGAAGAPQP